MTVWRELRRVNEQTGFIEEVRSASDAGDWAAFVKAMGGPNLRRKDQPIKPAYSLSENIDKKTGEILKVTHTEYGDEAKERIIGVLAAGVLILSRIHIWEVKENEKVRTAQTKIMTGVVDLLEEINIQNGGLLNKAPSIFLHQAQPDALDLCQ